MLSMQDLINEDSQLSQHTYQKFYGVDCVCDERNFLNALIYNVSFHNSSVDTVQSAALKLNSLMVKNMIGQIVQEHVRLFGRQ